MIRSASTSDSSDQLPLANQWFMQNHDRLMGQASFQFRHLPAGEREEAIAEALALAFGNLYRAAERGVLHHVTVTSAIDYAARQVRDGRQFAGTNSKCMLSPRRRRLSQTRPLSIEQMAEQEEDCHGTDADAMLSEALRDHRDDGPEAEARRHLDFLIILAKVDAKSRETFRFLASTKCDGRMADLAEGLGISRGRATQLKGKLAEVFADAGYEAPLVRRRTKL